MRLTLRQLQYFVAIVDAKSMAHAADALHVAPTALSLQVKALEEHFQTPLLTRHSRGVFPTQTGAELYARAKLVLAQIEDLERDLAPRATQEVQIVRLGVPPAIARIIGVEAFVGAARRFDAISLQVADGWTPDLVARLQHGDLDFVVGFGIQPTDGIRVVEVIEDRFVFAVAPERAGDRGPISMEEALRSDLVFYGEKSVGWSASVGAAQQAGHTLRKDRQVRSIDIWRSLLCRGLGTTITTRMAIVEEYERGELVIREIDGPPILRRIVIASRAENDSMPWSGAISDFLLELLLSSESRVGTFWRVLVGRGAGLKPGAMADVAK